MDEKLVEKCAVEEFEARNAYDALELMNIYGMSYDDRKRFAIEHAKARARLFSASQALTAAISKPDPA